MSYGLGKFSSAVDEVIFTIAFDFMWNDDHMGESDSPTGYFGKMEINLDDATAILADDSINEMIDAQDMPKPEDLVGFWIVTEDSSGFVNVSDMGDIPAMRDAYEELEKAYEDYLMCQQCVVCGVLLNEYNEDADGGRLCADTDVEHVGMERER